MPGAVDLLNGCRTAAAEAARHVAWWLEWQTRASVGEGSRVLDDVRLGQGDDAEAA